MKLSNIQQSLALLNERKHNQHGAFDYSNPPNDLRLRKDDIEWPIDTERQISTLKCMEWHWKMCSKAQHFPPYGPLDVGHNSAVMRITGIYGHARSFAAGPFPSYVMHSFGLLDYLS